MRSIERKFYDSAAWKKCREGYRKKVGGLCERCLARGLIVPGDIVHHKIYLTEDNYKDPSVALNWDNLEYLCKSCHDQEHFKTVVKPRYRIGDGGEVDILDDT